MAQWILQSVVPSITSAARRRTSYLMPLLGDVVAAVEAYLGAHPNGEEVTLAVLQALSRDRLERVRSRRSFGRVKQDVGLFTAQTLVDLHGANCVATLRRADGKSSSARRNTWPMLDWVDSFAPHRVLRPAPRVPRILLDTVTVRKVIYGDRDALDPVALAKLKGAHAVSIADGALAELAAALLRGSVPMEAWAQRIGMFDELLDPEFPVAPGGKELATLWGGQSPVGLDLGEMRAYYRAAWNYLRHAKSVEGLCRKEVFHAPSGRAYEIALDREHVDATLAEAGTRWSGWVTNVAAIIRNLRDDGETVTEADLRRLATSNLMLDMSAADAMKLDLVVHVLAKRAMQAVTGATPYSPASKPNDPLDLDLLFGIPLPAWICTVDMRLHRLVRSTTAADRDAVMTVEEILGRLAAEATGAAVDSKERPEASMDADSSNVPSVADFARRSQMLMLRDSSRARTAH